METSPSLERWRRADEILGVLIEAPTARRPSLLREVTEGDAELAREVEQLLGLRDRAEHFLETPLFPEPTPDGALAGRRIGPYRALKRLDRGGMGEVYLAVRIDDFEQRVAIKVPRPGLDLQASIRRFENERQILAGFSHPRIARLLDGGATEEGLPYLVLEYIEGRPIDRHCRLRELNPRECIRLFLEVCAAVEELHRHLIVHRDIKPGNVLVTDVGEPKLLDFGIAKPLTPVAALHEGLTEHDHAGPMTLLYASPEQANGLPLTTTSDVYSLGVLLFKTLTGRLPYRADPRSIADVARDICDHEPLSLRMALADREPRMPAPLARDLEAILGKALRKVPRERYGSVGALADDLRRLLDGHPVAARQGGWSYALGKFARRRKWVVAAIFSILFLLFASLVLWRRAVVERDRSERERLRKEGVADFLEDLFRDSRPDRDGEMTVREVLDRGSRRLESDLGIDFDIQADLASTLAETYRIHGFYPEARRLSSRSIALWRRALSGADHSDLAKEINNLAAIDFRLGHLEQAATGWREALAMWRRCGTSEAELVTVHNNLGSAALSAGRYAEAERSYREALVASVGASDIVATARSLINLGALDYNRDRLDRAEARLRHALFLFERAEKPSLEPIADAKAWLGRTLLAKDRFAEAERALEEAAVIRRPLGKDQPKVAEIDRDLATLFARTGRAVLAEPLARRALDSLQRRVPENRFLIASALGALGECIVANGRPHEAEMPLRKSLEELTELKGRSIYTREALARLIRAYEAMGLPERARPLRERVLNWKVGLNR